MFAEELRRRRQAAGLSLAGLAARVHYSKGYLSRVETGVKPATVELARSCDGALDAGGVLLALVGGSRRAAEASPQTDLDREVWALMMDRDGEGRLVALTRREALTVGAASVMAWGRGAPTDGGVTATDDVLAQLQALLRQTRRLGRAVGPTVVLPTVAAQFQSLRGLAAAARTSDRVALLRLAGRTAEFGGWMAQEAGDERAALWWTGTAAELAEAADDADLQAYTSVRRAGIMLYRGDGEATVALARRARHGAVPGWIEQSAWRREAQGHALAGDDAACRRALDQAVQVPGDAAQAAFGSTSLPEPDQLVTGWCLHDLGRYRDSARVLDAVAAAGTGEAGTGTRAVTRMSARRALAHAAAGEVEHACAITGAMLDDAVAVDSATIRADLRRLDRTLRRWHTHRAVRRVQPRLTAAYRRPTP